MRNQTFISFLALLLLASVSFIGCDNDGGGGSAQDAGALTENDFAEGLVIFANPPRGVVVTFLEPPDSEKPENDTGEVGNDIIPYRYSEDLNHTYCFEDENVGAEHFAILFDSDGNEVLRVEANGGCVTELIPAGDYYLEFTHDGKIEETLPIFAIPQQNGEQAAQRVDTDQRLFKSAKNQFSRIINNFYNIITQKAKAQTVAQNRSTLLRTKKCVGCNLSGANLSFADLHGANLSDATLTQADLSFANLRGADLSRATLTGVILDSSTIFDNATWCCGGCKCGSNSRGDCEFCESICGCTL